MKRLAILLGLMLAACQQASPPADNMTANANAGGTANVAETQPPFAETPGAHPTTPEPAPIPAKFRGVWADNEAACADPKHHSRLVISGRTVRHPGFVIIGDSFALPAPNQFALKGKIEATGAPAEAHYSINSAGDILTDEAGGGAVRARCG